ncbi:hypothetical protein GY31_03260 [Lysinibacillus sphaericus]|uniref:Uncharacterized protein n=1 Tax=Lysinibacillus sphaericus TaxID=1421 RepID=A0A2S5CY36_LYSSH|nr:hypothetical protein [Lysinibacillus sphaericus]OEC03287.1 hypothetical protein GY31_03260 [Lysinibacillus sphaericus]POZ55743.1 hypothetical protein LYSIN_00526 [Lysinibacillus sphaericus]
MEDRRYATHMNWAPCKCHKPCKCSHKKEHECKEEKCHKAVNNCRSCICEQLRKLEVGAVVDVLLAGTFLRLTFVSFNARNCCAYFLEAGSTSPLIIDCKKIDAIRIVRA